MEKSIYFYINDLEAYDLKVTYSDDKLYFDDYKIKITYNTDDYGSIYTELQEKGFSEEYSIFAEALGDWMYQDEENQNDIFHNFIYFACEDLYIMVSRIVYGLINKEDIIVTNMQFLLNENSITYVNYNKTLNLDKNINSNNLEKIYTDFIGKLKL